MDYSFLVGLSRKVNRHLFRPSTVLSLPREVKKKEEEEEEEEEEGGRPKPANGAFS